MTGLDLESWMVAEAVLGPTDDDAHFHKIFGRVLCSPSAYSNPADFQGAAAGLKIRGGLKRVCCQGSCFETRGQYTSATRLFDIPCSGKGGKKQAKLCWLVSFVLIRFGKVA